MRDFNRQKSVSGHWASTARVAISIVLNIEEGGELTYERDGRSETLIQEVSGLISYTEEPGLTAESLYEYGGKVGYYRLRRLLYNELRLPVTCFIVAEALVANDEMAKDLKATSDLWELSSHHRYWIDYGSMSKEKEAKQIDELLDIHKEKGFTRPTGFYAGKPSRHSRELAIQKGFKYLYDCYNTELPFALSSSVVVPYTLTFNDMQMVSNFTVGLGQWKLDIEAAVAELVEEANELNELRMISIGLHCRVVGHPHRTRCLRLLLKSLMGLQEKGDVIFMTRENIAERFLSLSS